MNRHLLVQLLAVQGSPVSLNFSCTFSDGSFLPYCHELRGLFYIVVPDEEVLAVVDVQGSSMQLTAVRNSAGPLHVQVLGGVYSFCRLD
jgi:hypothetical protein